jgi:hypothetical protein
MAAKRSEQEAIDRDARLRARRHLRFGTTDEGAVSIRGELAPVEGAAVKNALERMSKKVFETARAEGRRESHDAYMADSLLHLCLAGLPTAASSGAASSGLAGSSAAQSPAAPSSGAPSLGLGSSSAAPSSGLAGSSAVHSPAAPSSGLAGSSAAPSAGASCSGPGSSGLAGSSAAGSSGAPCSGPGGSSAAVTSGGGASSPGADGFEVGAIRRTPRAEIVLHVSAEALRRGEIGPGEYCEIEGVGPVSLATVEYLFGDAWAKLVIEKGVDIASVTHFGRNIPAHLDTALRKRDRVCQVPGCGITWGLERDHIVPVEEGGPTELANLAMLCHRHHVLKTNKYWRLIGSPGNWEWVNIRPEQDTVADGDYYDVARPGEPTAGLARPVLRPREPFQPLEAGAGAQDPGHEFFTQGSFTCPKADTTVVLRLTPALLASLGRTGNNPPPSSHSTGAQSTGAQSTGAPGAHSTGAHSNNRLPTGGDATISLSTAGHPTGAHPTGAQSTGSHSKSGLSNIGISKSGISNIGISNIGISNSMVSTTGGDSAGGHSTGAHPTLGHSTGTHSTLDLSTGGHSTGPQWAGGHPTEGNSRTEIAELVACGRG